MKITVKLTLIGVIEKEAEVRSVYAGMCKSGDTRREGEQGGSNKEVTLETIEVVRK